MCHTMRTEGTRVSVLAHSIFNYGIRILPDILPGFLFMKSFQVLYLFPGMDYWSDKNDKPLQQDRQLHRVSSIFTEPEDVHQHGNHPLFGS